MTTIIRTITRTARPLRRSTHDAHDHDHAAEVTPPTSAAGNRPRAIRAAVSSGGVLEPRGAGGRPRPARCRFATSHDSLRSDPVGAEAPVAPKSPRRPAEVERPAGASHARGRRRHRPISARSMPKCRRRRMGEIVEVVQPPEVIDTVGGEQASQSDDAEDERRGRRFRSPPPPAPSAPLQDPGSHQAPPDPAWSR